MTKKMIQTFLILAISSVFSNASTEDVIRDSGKEAINAAKEVALSKQGKIVLRGVTLDCKFDGEEFILIGNGCNELSADDIQAFSSTIKADVKIRKAGVIGNIGNKVSTK